MSSTTASTTVRTVAPALFPPPARPAEPLATADGSENVAEVEVLGEGPTGTLSFLTAMRRRQDEAAARELVAVTHWADLHRSHGVVGAVDPAMATLAERPVLGLEGELRLAGQGAFAVEEFAVTELAAALGMSESAARGYVGQALELRERLPKLWGRVMAGVLPAWKARQVAAETIALNAAAAGYVDAHLAPFAEKVSVRRILRAVNAAVLRHDPQLAKERAQAAAEGRGVWLEDQLDGTTSINAVTGTPDATAFNTALNQVAATLAHLGGPEPHQVLRSKAVGVLADPQYALDLATTAGATATEAGDPVPPSTARMRPVKTGSSGPVIHVHLHTDALTGTGAESTGGGVVRVDRFGPRTLAAVEQWLADLAPGSRVTLTPVVDTTERISVDGYEVPDRLRAQVEESQDCCRFPWCGRQGRFDVDHIDPYLPMAEGGPRGQTNSDNTARLCRFHHRVKTHGRWRYHRVHDDMLVWTSPLGRVYAVDTTGTYPRS